MTPALLATITVLTVTAALMARPARAALHTEEPFAGVAWVSAELLLLVALAAALGLALTGAP